MNDREKFMENWKLQRQKGQIKYVLSQAGRIAGFGLAGVVVGSIFIYDSPSTYSFAYYLPTYILVSLGVFIAAAFNFLYIWGKNEDKYNQ